MFNSCAVALQTESVAVLSKNRTSFYLSEIKGIYSIFLVGVLLSGNFC